MRDCSKYSPEQNTEQTVETIPLDSLVLWTENPRDPIDASSDNEAIIRNALNEPEHDQKWRLKVLAKEMGDDFDFSEIPTVVKIDGTEKYRVYDGNRRVILAILKNRGWPLEGGQFALPFFPDAIPCNVCSEEVALRHVFRKHNGTGTWKPYERDLFAYTYMGETKSVLLRIEELCGAISTWPQLNQRFVRDDVLNTKHLSEIGLDPKRDDYGIPRDILIEIVRFVADEVDGGALQTRGKRNDPKSVFPTELLSKIQHANDLKRNAQTEIDPDRDTALKTLELLEQEDQVRKNSDSALIPKEGKGRTPTTQPPEFTVFGCNKKGLTLKTGSVNNLYRTLEELWIKNEKGELRCNASFVAIFRMGLRLLVETAAIDCGLDLASYINEYAVNAKKSLTSIFGSRDVLTYLSSHSVEPNSMVKLLQVGAHDYAVSNTRDQALAMSILIGAMLLQSHNRFK